MEISLYDLLDNTFFMIETKLNGYRKKYPGYSLSFDVYSNFDGSYNIRLVGVREETDEEYKQRMLKLRQERSDKIKEKEEKDRQEYVEYLRLQEKFLK